MNNRRFVVVTTNKDRRGVFGGYLETTEADRVVLTDAHNCIHWSRMTKGVFGLAAIGPQAGSRIGPAVPRLELDGVTSISDCTDAAREKWQEEPWD